MLGTPVRSESLQGPLSLGRQPIGLASYLRPVIFVLVAALVAVGAWYAAQVVVLDYKDAAAFTSSVAEAGAPLKPDTAVQVTTRGAGVELEGAQLFRADVADDGSRSPERAVPMRLAPSGQDGVWTAAADGDGSLLRPDGAYRLVVRVAAPHPALPMPRSEILDKQYRFLTVASPHARLPKDVLHPRWSDPVSFTWSERMRDVSVSVQPAAPIRTWVDSADRTRTWVQLGGDGGAGLADGQTYRPSRIRSSKR